MIFRKAVGGMWSLRMHPALKTQDLTFPMTPFVTSTYMLSGLLMYRLDTWLLGLDDLYEPLLAI